MNSKFILFVSFSLVIGVITYIALENIFISLGVLAVYLLISILVLVPMINKYEIKTKRYHECYHFINNFVIALSIKKSTKGALETTVNSMPSEFMDLYEGLENMNDDERLNYLTTYFPFHCYQLFLQIVRFWEDSGGDILKASKFLIEDIRNDEEYISKSHSLFIRKVVEIITLWGFCLFIVVVLRFAIKEFYGKIQTQLIYIVSIIVLMMFILFTIYLLLVKGTSLKIKGVSENEKIS